MGQGSEVAATTDIRRFLHALRPVAMLGGFVVMWWLLATGAAQADAGSKPDAGTNRVLTGAVDRAVQRPVDKAVRAVDRVADRVDDRARPASSAPAKVVKAVRHHTAPVLSATKAAVRNTPAKPIVTAASDTVRSHVTQVDEQTRAVLETAPVTRSIIPELEGPADVIEDLPVLGESATLQAETATQRPVENAVENVFEIGALQDAADTTNPQDGAAGTALAGQADTAPGTPLGGGSEGPALQSSGATAASSVQSGSAGTGTGAALCETAFDLTLLATKTSLSSLADWQPAGPAYPPAATPD